MVVNKRFSLGSLVVLMCICLGSQALMAQEKQVSEEPETKKKRSQGHGEGHGILPSQRIQLCH